MEAAIEVLREKGLQATAVKKSGRIAAEGIVYTTVNRRVRQQSCRS